MMQRFEETEALLVLVQTQKIALKNDFKRYKKKADRFREIAIFLELLWIFARNASQYIGVIVTITGRVMLGDSAVLLLPREKFV